MITSFPAVPIPTRMSREMRSWSESRSIYVSVTTSIIGPDPVAETLKTTGISFIRPA